MKLPVSFVRIKAVFLKEFIQMRRDRLTLVMMLGIPLIQLTLFGFAINNNPKHLPALVNTGDSFNPFAERYIQALESSQYFILSRKISSEPEAGEALLNSDASYVINFPPGFYNKLLRGEHPQILLEVDATDPQIVGSGVAVASRALDNTMKGFFTGPLSYLGQEQPAASLAVHKNFNPEEIMQYSTVPGLLGVILTLTLVMITSLSMAREIERGTMENLLCMPVRPIEVLIGKMTPYIGLGFIQMVFVLVVSETVFNIPVCGSLLLLICMGVVFITACLAVGIVFSTLARNQLQAVQMSSFFFLPSIMLSGFMFPFKAMPLWAQFIGYVFPLTHFNVIIRGIMLKGSSFSDIQFRLYCIVAFTIAVMAIGVSRYRKNLE